MNDGSIIQVRDLTKIYRVGDIDVAALRGVSLEIARGDFVSIIGPSGSGKSTLFHILGGLTPPSGGSVSIAGRDLSHMTERERTLMRRTTVGFVFQKYNLLPTLSAADNIEIARHIARSPLERALAHAKTHPDAQFEEALELLGIAHRLKHKPRSLSGGEQQRVAIARAIVNHPAILLADEPTGNLDTANSNAVLSLLRDLNRRIGQTVLMITHNPEAASYAHRVVSMRDGRIVD